MFSPSLDYVPRRCKAKFKDGGEHATFNDFPIPQGCWKTEYNRNQKTYMTILLSGIAALTGAVALVGRLNLSIKKFSFNNFPFFNAVC